MRLSDATHRLLTALLVWALFAAAVVAGSFAIGVRPW